MRKDGVLRTIAASPVGAALAAYLANTAGGFNGMLSELLDRLDRYRPHGEAWPRSPKGLGGALRRLAPALRLIGYECENLPKIGGVIRWHVSPSPSRLSQILQVLPCRRPARPSGEDRGSQQEMQDIQDVILGSQAWGKGMPLPHDGAHPDDGKVF